jgi:hypothetical protein
MKRKEKNLVIGIVIFSLFVLTISLAQAIDVKPSSNSKDNLTSNQNLSYQQKNISTATARISIIIMPPEKLEEESKLTGITGAFIKNVKEFEDDKILWGIGFIVVMSGLIFVKYLKQI